MPEHRHLLPSRADDQDGLAGLPPDTSEASPAGGAQGPLAAFTGLLADGEGSNNIAELWGPAMLIQLLEWHEAKTGTCHTGPIAIFIDSQLTIDICMHIARPKANRELARAVRRVVRTRNRKNTVFLYWIAGHADIPENDMVDKCAKKGARQAAAGVGMEVSLGPSHGAYLPLGQAPFQYHRLQP